LTKLDQIDRQIIEILQDNGRITNNDLAKRVGLTTTPTLERVKRLEREGIIKGYSAVVDRDAIDRGLTVFCSVKLSVHEMGEMVRFSENVAETPEILACYNTTGEYDYLLHVVVKDTKAYEKFMRTKLTRLPGIERIHTSIVLSVLKENSKITVTDNDERED
jgi:DNA-binding Lrp family transcriptional regulator